MKTLQDIINIANEKAERINNTDFEPELHLDYFYGKPVIANDQMQIEVLNYDTDIYIAEDVCIINITIWDYYDI